MTRRLGFAAVCLLALVALTGQRGNPTMDLSTCATGKIVKVISGDWACADDGAGAATVLTNTATWDPASINGGAETNTTLTVTGAAVGNPAVCSLTTHTTQDVAMSATISAANTVRVVVTNLSGSAVDLGSGTLRCAVFQF